MEVETGGQNKIIPILSFSRTCSVAVAAAASESESWTG